MRPVVLGMVLSTGGRWLGVRTNGGMSRLLRVVGRTGQCYWVYRAAAYWRDCTLGVVPNLEPPVILCPRL